MLDLNEYKMELINFRELNNQEMQSVLLQLSREYNDEYLSKIINDTYDFAMEILDSDIGKNGFGSIELCEDGPHIGSIYFCIPGSGTADNLFYDLRGRIISERCLKHVFGPHFDIWYSEENVYRESEVEDEDWWDIAYLIKVQGISKDIGEIRKKLSGKSKTMIKK